jgi:hypothetical protein
LRKSDIKETVTSVSKDSSDDYKILFPGAVMFEIFDNLPCKYKPAQNFFLPGLQYDMDFVHQLKNRNKDTGDETADV